MHPLIQFVGWAYLRWDRDGETFPFDGFLHRFQPHAYFIKCQNNSTCSRTRYHYFITAAQLPALHMEFRNTYIGKISHTLGTVFLGAGGRGAVFALPFAETLAEIITVPEAAVKDLVKFGIPSCDLVFGICAVAYGTYRLTVAFYGKTHILRPTGAPLYLEHRHSGINHFVKEMDSLQILGRHDVFIINGKLLACLTVGDRIGTAAYLCACPTVG